MKQIDRVADPGGFYPDLDSTLEKKTGFDSDLREEKPGPNLDTDQAAQLKNGPGSDLCKKKLDPI